MAMRGLPPYLLRDITIITSNQAAIQVINLPKHQSGQASVVQIYDAVRELREGYNRVLLITTGMFLPLQLSAPSDPRGPAGLASTAEDRTLNTWRTHLQTP
ncbi:hypothetical protein DL95DRAFT_91008 [Leptodontidium sp. 2 PMI_412]|nr:hypothetical protein DL95DRAFT_91008 [Leptodontidium sp. 2 PMI_412]